MTGKILIKCDLVVRTGLHIGGSSSFSAIGTVDSPVIRDPFTGLPIVPGSSLKGKLRTLLARRSCVNGETLPDFSADGEVLLRMFGSSEPVRFARLQFADAFLLNYDQLKGVGVTEVKSENTINRLTSKANPRQIERVVAGSRFGVNIVYNLSDPKEMEEDLLLLSKAMKLLQLDYLGGHGSRGNGRVSFQNFQVIPYPETLNIDLDGIRQTFKTEVEEYELFSTKAGVGYGSPRRRVRLCGRLPVLGPDPARRHDFFGPVPHGAGSVRRARTGGASRLCRCGRPAHQ